MGEIVHSWVVTYASGSNGITHTTANRSRRVGVRYIVLHRGGRFRRSHGQGCSTATAIPVPVPVPSTIVFFLFVFVFIFLPAIRLGVRVGVEKCTLLY